MAKFNVAGIEDIEKRLLYELERAAKAVPKMLKAGAKILVKAQKEQVRAMGLIDTGALEKSIEASKVARYRDGGRAIHVRPVGEDAKGKRNAEKGYQSGLEC